MQQLRVTPRAQLHDMWSKEPKQARIREPRVLHLRKQNHHQRAEVNLETTKAVAWAVFQHHGGGDGGAHNRHGLQQQQHNMAARRPSRFKIEAQMKHELAHHTYTPPLVGAPRWDAGSTLFDSFELESLLRTLDQATHPLHDDDDDLYDDDDDARAVVLYSPNAQPQSRLGDEYEDEEEDDEDEEFWSETPAKSKRVAVVPVKEELKAHHHNMWKSFLHSLHLDGFHKLQSQVAPHDVAAQSKKKHSKRARGRSGGMDAQQQQQQEHRHQLWKLSVKAAIKGQEQDLQSALAVASEAVSQQKQQHHHHHHHYQHHHHHVHDEREDDEMTIQAITKRAARTSLDETRRRVSIEFERGNGLEAPRNSLDIDDRERAGVPKSLSLWDVFEL